ncbi:MAG: TonB-dependent receptor [Opitutus sp.]|nr:TonB-dependent receptor [Opitutus sp.]
MMQRDAPYFSEATRRSGKRRHTTRGGCNRAGRPRTPRNRPPHRQLAGDRRSAVHSISLLPTMSLFARFVRMVSALPSRAPTGRFVRCLRPRTGALTLAALAFAAAPVGFSQPAAAAIAGRVQNIVTGDYLNNARVAVKGTALVTLTDQDGGFRITDVPPGPATLRVFFTGLDEKEIPLTVAAGQTMQVDVQLTSKARYGESNPVRLDAFVVQTTKETNAAAIAVNEQRFSANQKSVVSADQFGTIPDSNPGELVKWLPGVSVEYFANTIVGVSVRGLDSANTEIVFDGMPVASTTSTSQNLGRGLEVRSASASDISRIEVSKLSLPENSANSLGGSINFIRRSAFEYSRRKIEYNALFTSDGSEFTLAERAGPKDRLRQWWRPNLRLTWTEPVSKTFGFAVTVGHDDKITRVHWAVPVFNFGTVAQATAADADIAAKRPLTTTSVYNPARTEDLLHDNPVLNYKDYATVKVDWKPAPGLRLSYSINAGLFQNETADDIRIRWGTGANPIRVDASGTYGAPGVGWVNFDTREGWRDEYNPTITNGLEAEWRKGAWTLSAKGSFSTSRHILKDIDNGFFNNMSGLAVGNGIRQTGIGAASTFANTPSSNPRAITVNLLNSTKYISQNIEARDPATGQLIDWADPANMNIGGATSRQGRSKAEQSAMRLFARHAFQLRNNPISVQLGFDYDESYRNRQRYDTQYWNFVGPDGIRSTADDSAAQIVSLHVKPVRDDVYNAQPVPRLSMTRLYEIYQAHPTWFSYNGLESYKSTVATPYQLDEKTYAPYLQIKGGLFANRLTYAGGVRYERADAWGLGLLTDASQAFQKYSDGTVRRVGDVLGATGLPTRWAGAPVRRADVPAGSVQEAVLTLIRNGARGEGTNDNFFTSLHFNYDLKPNLKFMIGYAKTQAKNRFDRTVIPSTSVNDSPVTTGEFAGIALGTVNVRNANLEPWVGHNYETHLEYYTPQGGVISVGAFRKNIHNWQITKNSLLDSAERAADFDIGAEYVGYQISTFQNDGNGRIDGAEFELRQPLDPFVPNSLGWLKGFHLVGSFNQNDLRKRGNNIGGDFSTLYQTQAKASLSYRKKKLYGNVGIINYGKVFRQQEDAAGHYGTRFYPPFNTIDFNASYAITRWAKLFVSGSNITGARKLRERVIEGAPAWSRVQNENHLGQTYTVGITGEL